MSDPIIRVNAGLLGEAPCRHATIGVEIVSPDATSIDEILSVFDTLGLGRPDLSELAPIVAA